MSPRDTCKRVIAPGIWEDIEGGIHFSTPKLLEAFDLPDTPEHRAIVEGLVVHALRSVMQEKGIDPDSPQGEAFCKVVFRDSPDNQHAGNN